MLIGILAPIQNTLLSDVFGSYKLFAMGLILIFAIFLFALRVPPIVVLLILAPLILIGGGNLIAGAIPGWVKGLVIMGIFALVGLMYMAFTSGNR